MDKRRAGGPLVNPSHRCRTLPGTAIGRHQGCRSQPGWPLFPQLSKVIACSDAYEVVKSLSLRWKGQFFSFVRMGQHPPFGGLTEGREKFSVQKSREDIYLSSRYWQASIYKFCLFVLGSIQGHAWKKESKCLNGTPCPGQLCIMEDLIGTYRQSEATSFGSALALDSGAELNPRVSSPVAHGASEHGGAWGKRKKREAGPAFSPLYPPYRTGLERTSPVYVKGLKAAGSGFSCPFQKDVACQRSENVDRLASCLIVIILWG